MEFSSRKITEWWQQQLAQYFLWWAIGLAVVIVGGGSWFILRPLYHNVQANNQATELSVRLDEARDRLAKLKSKSEAWSLKNQDEAINLILPSYNDLPSLLVQLEALADHSKFQLQGIAVTEQAPGAGKPTSSTATAPVAAGVHELRVTLSLTNGTYARLRDFLQAAQSAWRLVAVKSINFSRDGSYAVELTSYYYTY